MKNTISADINEWFEIYRSTEPIDRKEAEKWITKAYHLCGEKTPNFIWVKGPKEAYIINRMCESVDDKDYLKVIKSAPKEIEKNKNIKIGNNKFYHFSGGGEVADVVYCQAKFFKEKPDKYNDMDEDKKQKYHVYSAIVKYASSWHQWKNIVVAQERPLKFEVELLDNGHVRKHCEDGPAIAWGDGTKLYFLNNVLVPPWLVDTPPEDLTARHYVDEKNVEIRREIYRKIGWPRLVKEFKGKLIDTWQPTIDEMEYVSERGKLVEPYRLWEVMIPVSKNENVRAVALQMFLTDKHGLRSEYLPFVRPEITTARDALFSLPKDNRVPRDRKILLG